MVELLLKSVADVQGDAAKKELRKSATQRALSNQSLRKHHEAGKSCTLNSTVLPIKRLNKQGATLNYLDIQNETSVIKEIILECIPLVLTKWFSFHISFHDST